MSLCFGAGIYLTGISPFLGTVPFADTHSHVINCVKCPFFVVFGENWQREFSEGAASGLSTLCRSTAPVWRHV